MNRRIIVITFLILYFTFIIGLQAQDTWVKSYAPFGSSNLENYTVRNITICQDDGYAVNGTYKYDDEWPNPITIEFGFLMKTDSDGNFQWAKKDTVSFIERTESLAFVETDDGGFISAVTNSTIGGGNALIKRDSNGNREWVVDNDEFQVWSMAKTSDGNIVLSGMLSLNLPAIRKITPSGTEIWTQTYNPNNGRETGRLFSIIETSDGGLASTGYIQGNNLDIFILKTDVVGDTLWTRTYDGFGYGDLGYCIIETSSSDFLIYATYEEFISSINIFLTYSNNGYLFSSHTFDEIIQASAVIQTQDEDFVSCAYPGNLKFDSEYNVEWLNDYGGYGGDKCIIETNDNFLVFPSTHYSGSTQSIKITKTDENGQVTSIDDYVISKKNNLSLKCYPNPFNPITTISFDVLENTVINLRIYNIKGQLVKKLIDNEYTLLGTYQVIWDGSGISDNTVSSGIYYICLRNDSSYVTKKVLLIK